MAEKHPKRPRDPSQLARHIIGIATGEVEDRELSTIDSAKDPDAVRMGQKGGKARAAKLSSSKRKEIARKAAKARWK